MDKKDTFMDKKYMPCICQSRFSVIATTHAVMEYANQNSAYAICQSEYGCPSGNVDDPGRYM